MGGGKSRVSGEGRGGCAFFIGPLSLALRAFPLPLKGARGLSVAPERDQDCAQDAVEVGHHVRVREPDHSVASLFERPCPRRVVSFTAAMRVAVELDHEALAALAKSAM